METQAQAQHVEHRRMLSKQILWIPAFAGMTNGTRHPWILGGVCSGAQPEPCDRPKVHTHSHPDPRHQAGAGSGPKVPFTVIPTGVATEVATEWRDPFVPLLHKARGEKPQHPISAESLRDAEKTDSSAARCCAALRIAPLGMTEGRRYPWIPAGLETHRPRRAELRLLRPRLRPPPKN